MPFAARNFTDPLYHQERLQTMSWLDKVASFLLAMNWSTGGGAAGGGPVLNTPVTLPNGTHTRVRNRQLESHLECVAVAWEGGTFYIAANRLSITDNDVILADTSLGRPVDAGEFFAGVDYYHTLSASYEILHGNDFMHAEMKIMKRLHELGRLRLRHTALGVSKPCCPMCRQVLDAWQVIYTSYHAVPPHGDHWVDPHIGIPSDNDNLLRDLFL